MRLRVLYGWCVGLGVGVSGCRWVPVCSRAGCGERRWVGSVGASAPSLRSSSLIAGSPGACVRWRICLPWTRKSPPPDMGDGLLPFGVPCDVT